jgi:hypothetical protein
MGKANDTGGGLVAVDEVCAALHQAGADLRQAAIRVLGEPSPMTSDEFRLAGMALAWAEQLRIASLAARVQFGGQVEAVPPAFRAPSDKPKRVRGPRKPKASAAERTGMLPGAASAHLLDDDELERATRPEPRAATNGGAS